MKASHKRILKLLGEDGAIFPPFYSWEQVCSIARVGKGGRGTDRGGVRKRTVREMQEAGLLEWHGFSGTWTAKQTGGPK